MVDLQSILAEHSPKIKVDDIAKEKNTPNKRPPSVAEIPDLFFDHVLVEYKLSRVDVLVLMYIYRRVWCRPNLHKEFGIGPVISYDKMAEDLRIKVGDLFTSIRKLESLDFLETIRSGQYFVRKYFTKENDQAFGQDYDDF